MSYSPWDRKESATSERLNTLIMLHRFVFFFFFKQIEGLW